MALDTTTSAAATTEHAPAPTAVVPRRSARRHLLLAGLAGVAGALGVGAALFGRNSQHPALAQAPTSGLGDAFWSQRFDRVNGGVIALSALAGKPLLLNFWATWCPPCIEELPLIDRFFLDQPANGLQVVGLAIDQPASVQKFLARKPVGYAMGLATAQGMDLLRQLGNTGGGLPFTIALRADGGVMGRKAGKLEASDLDAWGREILGG